MLVYRFTVHRGGTGGGAVAQSSPEFAKMPLCWFFCYGNMSRRERSFLQTHQIGPRSGARLGRGLALSGMVELGPCVDMNEVAAAIA